MCVCVCVCVCARARLCAWKCLLVHVFALHALAAVGYALLIPAHPPAKVLVGQELDSRVGHYAYAVGSISLHHACKIMLRGESLKRRCEARSKWKDTIVAPCKHSHTNTHNTHP